MGGEKLSTNPILKHYESLERPESPSNLPTESCNLTLRVGSSRFDKDAGRWSKNYAEEEIISSTEEIDDAIDLIRGMKKMEVDSP